MIVILRGALFWECNPGMSWSGKPNDCAVLSVGDQPIATDPPFQDIVIQDLACGKTRGHLQSGAHRILSCECR